MNQELYKAYQESGLAKQKTYEEFLEGYVLYIRKMVTGGIQKQVEREIQDRPQ